MPQSQATIAHLRDHIDLIFLFVQRHIARHGHRMVQADGTLSQLYVSFKEARALLGRESLTGGEGQLSRQEGWPSVEEADKAIIAQRRRIEQRLKAGYGVDGEVSLPVEDLRGLLGLNAGQVALLLAAAAPALSVDMARLFTFAWADFATKKPTVGFLAELIGGDQAQSVALLDDFRDDAPLVRARLIEVEDGGPWGRGAPLIHRSVQVADPVVHFLRGHLGGLPAPLRPFCTWRGADESAAGEALCLAPGGGESLKGALRYMSGHREAPGRLLLLGEPGVGRRTVLGAFLAALGKGLLEVDLGAMVSHWPQTWPQWLARASRGALLRGGVMLLRGDGVLTDRERFEALAPVLGDVLEGVAVWVVISARRAVAGLHGIISGLLEVKLKMPEPPQQQALWHRALKDAGWPEPGELPEAMARRFHVAPGTILESVGRVRLEMGMQRGRKRKQGPTLEQLHKAIQGSVDHTLSQLAEPLTTSMSWDDVVLPDDLMEALQEVIANVRHRDLVFDTWGFRRKLDYGRGLSCLFAGPPGTGKTMMAAIIAQAVGREAYRVDLSRIASKWVGETEKNLSRVFDEAEKAQAILLFDEADSLFSARTRVQSANDRFANMEINYLLQRMESYEGMTVLTTNFEQGLDEAFRRRIKFRLSFPVPDGPLRRRLWRSMVPEEAALSPGVDFDELADTYEMSGGNIKNAVVRAAFYAAQRGTAINQAHFHQAARAEARKMGSLVRSESR